MSKLAVLTLSLPIMAVAVALMTPVSAYGENTNGDFWSGIGVLSGDVTYRIGGNFTSPQPGSSAVYPFPLSKLEWPLNVTVMTFGADIPLYPGLELCTGFSKNVTTFSGKVKDSDYDSAGSGTLVIYSESDSDVQAITSDTVLRYWLLQDKQDDLVMGFGVGAGWIYEQFNWTASNIVQSDLTGPVALTAAQSGLVGTYYVATSIPYLELAGKIEQTNSLSVLFSFGYSPFAAVNDWDNHLLRQISATSSLNGGAFKLSLKGKYDFAPNWFLTGRGDLLSFDMKGIENDLVYGNADNASGNFQGDTWTIEHETSSTQYLFSFNVGRKF